MVDIHQYERKYQQVEAQVRNSEISQHNKDLIFAYRDACLLLNTCKRVRLIRVMGALLLFARILNQEFDTLTKRDVERLIAHLLGRNPPYSAETLGTYKAIVKRFLTWVLAPDEFPRGTPPHAVKWLTTHVRRSEKAHLNRNDLLTPSDVTRVLGVTRLPRDQALINCLWETGCRISELGNLQVKHVSKAPHGFFLELTGKTGRRTVLVVSTAPYLAQWLALHPFINDRESPLWVHYQYHDAADFLRYDTIRTLLTRLFRRAGITKAIYPHLFRHSRATYMIASGLMTEAQAKKYFGWTPDTNMLATYTHLIDSDANNAILREHQLAPHATSEHLPTPQRCTTCAHENMPHATFCTRCTRPLGPLGPQPYDDEERVARTLARVIIERGLLDDAAKALHDEGLGTALHALAQRAKDN
jgi:integrase/recombinase XerD